MDEATIEARETVIVGALMNLVGPDEKNLSEASLRIETPPTLRTVAVVDNDGGLEISYIADLIGGTDTAGYVICDADPANGGDGVDPCSTETGRWCQ